MSTSTCSFSESFANLRKGQNLSGPQLAAVCGVSSSTIWRWESSKSLPRDNEIALALTVLNASQEDRRAILAQLDAERGLIERPRQQILATHRGELLFACRKRRGWSQERAAAETGVSRRILDSWERYETWPDDARLQPVLRALGVSPQELCAFMTGLAGAESSFASRTENGPNGSDREAEMHRINMARQALESLDTFQDLDLHYLALRMRAQSLPSTNRARALLATVTLDYVRYLMLQGRSREAERLLALVEEAIEQYGGRGEWAAIIGRLVKAKAELQFALAGRRQGVVNALKLAQAAEKYQAAMPPAVSADLCSLLGYLLAMSGCAAAAEEYSNQALEYARRSESSLEWDLRFRDHISILADAGMPEKALDLVDRGPRSTRLLAIHNDWVRGDALKGVGLINEARQNYEMARSEALAAGLVGQAKLLENRLSRL